MSTYRTKLYSKQDTILNQLRELEKDVYNFKVDLKGIEVEFIHKDFSSIQFDVREEKVVISYHLEVEKWTLLMYFCNHSIKKSYYQEFNRQVLNTTYMIDMSRNNVLKLETLKKWVRILAILGINRLGLYMEDTYEIKEEPYFGYLRGRYSQEELKEIDEYAASYGVEVIPYIQTLAHLETIAHWCVYRFSHFDVNDILLVENEKVYTLIEHMAKAISTCFKTREINIGMDEAYLLGRGKYLDQHGYTSQTEIFTKHLKKVLSIFKKYHFHCSIFSDMFYNGKVSYQKELEDVSLVHWDYCLKDESQFEKQIKDHLKLTKDISFAGGDWSWLGFTPNIEFGIRNLKESFKASIKTKLSQYIYTSWGDNGGECSKWSSLYSLFYLSRLNYDLEIQNQEFEKMFHLSIEQFCTLDLPNKIKGNHELTSFSKVIFYSDPLLGFEDTIIKEDQVEFFKENLKLLDQKNSWWGDYIFKTQIALLEVLIEKCTFGLDLRKYYNEHDLFQLQNMVKRCDILIKKIQYFYNAFLTQWTKESKGFGFDVQDLRIGGLIKRIEHAKQLIQEYCGHKISKIEELEVPLLDFYGNGEDYTKATDLCEYSYQHIASVNVNK